MHLRHKHAQRQHTSPRKATAARSHSAPSGAGASEESVAQIVLDGVRYDFPGCRAVHLSREDYEEYNGRVELWDAPTETALVCEENSPYHERSSVRLSQLIHRIEEIAGVRIEVLGASDLLKRDSGGNRLRVVEPDQVIFMRPMMNKQVGGAFELDHDEIPDVVLEVDLTTDIRRGKLKLYEAWGFPAVWVDVPNTKADLMLTDGPTRRPPHARQRPGTTIYRLGPDGYTKVDTSAAFPSWTAAEIHACINETTYIKPLSEATASILLRVGLLMREAAGQGADNDPILRVHRAESRQEWRAEGLAEGGQAEKRRAFRQLAEANLKQKGVELSPDFDQRLPTLADVSWVALFDALNACRDEADLWRQIELGGRQ